jgi:hypothetical protein
MRYRKRFSKLGLEKVLQAVVLGWLLYLEIVDVMLLMTFSS